uniref:Uncharacterized protein n=1 Tax=Romanomermis culicivorax TaxID=13658 RepID=A0A915KLJ1_ROMCU
MQTKFIIFELKHATLQTIDQIIGAVSYQLQPQQPHVQREIQEQTKATNGRFAALAEQMQQLTSTTTTATNARNLPTPRPLPVSSQFHGKKREILTFQMKPSVKPNQLKSLADCLTKSNLKRHRLIPCTITNFPAPQGEKKNYPNPRLKEANRPQPVISASQITRQTIIMTTRNLGTKCGVHLTAKKIAASKQLSTICTS